MSYKNLLAEIILSDYTEIGEFWVTSDMDQKQPLFN